MGLIMSIISERDNDFTQCLHNKPVHVVLKIIYGQIKRKKYIYFDGILFEIWLDNAVFRFKTNEQ